MTPTPKLWVIEIRDTEPRERDLFRKVAWRPLSSVYHARRSARSWLPYWRERDFETRVRCYVARGDS